MNAEIKSYVHVALVLDASGSMTHLRDSTVATMKEFFTSLASPGDRVTIDLWQFDDRVRHLLDGVDLASGSLEAVESYATGGCTALYDAICTGIDGLGAKFAAMRESDRPDAVVFAILTDGFENASKSFTVRDVKSRIEHQTDKYAWNFRFLAANQDAVLTGREMGLAMECCKTIDASGDGVRACCRQMSEKICGGIMPEARMRRAGKSRKQGF